MKDERLEIEEVVGILDVVVGFFELVAGEPADRVERLPQRNERELRLVALRAAQHVDAPVARRGATLTRPGPLQVAGVGVGLGGRRHAMPDARDQLRALRAARAWG